VPYLVGWQFDGHDSKYPSWAEVNPRLKRPQDPDARASFLWLAEEAKRLNAFVSVHIDAFGLIGKNEELRQTVCGGGDGGNQRLAAKPSGWAHLPEAGCLYEEAWGVSIDNDLSAGRGGMKRVVGKLCTRTLPWFFLNRHRVLSYEDGGDVFMPALWTKTGEWFVYSKAGGTRTWPVPDAWKSRAEVLAYALSDDGRSPATVMPIRDGKLTVQLDPGRGFAMVSR